MISSARVAGMLLQGFCWELALPYEEDALNKIATETRAAGLEIITAKGATYFGIGAALARIVCAILRDEHAVLAVSSLVPESMGLGEVSLSLPGIHPPHAIGQSQPFIIRRGGHKCTSSFRGW